MVLPVYGGNGLSEYFRSLHPPVTEHNGEFEQFEFLSGELFFAQAQKRRVGERRIKIRSAAMLFHLVRKLLFGVFLVLVERLVFGYGKQIRHGIAFFVNLLKRIQKLNVGFLHYVFGFLPVEKLARNHIPHRTFGEAVKLFEAVFIAPLKSPYQFNESAGHFSLQSIYENTCLK